MKPKHLMTQPLARLLCTVSALLTLAAPAHAFAGGKRNTAPKVMTGTVNLNNATQAQLDLLPGVGQKAAERIITYRQKTPFTRPEELVRVKGFGKKKFDKLKGVLSVSGATTLRVLPSTGAEPAPPVQGRTGPAAR